MDVSCVGAIIFWICAFVVDRDASDCLGDASIPKAIVCGSTSRFIRLLQCKRKHRQSISDKPHELEHIAAPIANGVATSVPYDTLSRSSSVQSLVPLAGPSPVSVGSDACVGDAASVQSGGISDSASNVSGTRLSTRIFGPADARASRFVSRLSKRVKAK